MTKVPKEAPSPALAHVKTPKTGATSSSPNSMFIGMALDMSWKLAIVVLVPILGGVWCDRHFSTSPVGILVGFALAMIGTGVVLWQAMQTANRLPVPKLTAAQKRKIQRQYEEDDE